MGLPVARAGADLIDAPEVVSRPNQCLSHQGIRPGGHGGRAVDLWHRGDGPEAPHAEALRREFKEALGIAEAVARQRLQTCVDRFVDVKRAGPLEYKDNRTSNEFYLAEVFEIKNFLKEDAKSSWYNLEVAAEIVANLLPAADCGIARQTTLCAAISLPRGAHP